MRQRVLVALLAALVCACSTYREHLNRGQRLYDENEFDRALAIWRDLEQDMDSLSLNDQARYAYLRGMTDYRLGFRPDARHWLAIAKAIEQEHPGGLTPEWKTRVDEALTDLNRDVYGGAEGLRPAEGPPGQPPAPGAPMQPGATPPPAAPPPAPGAIAEPPPPAP